MHRHPDRVFTFAPHWSRTPIHVAAFRDGRHRATLTVTGRAVLSDAEWLALAVALDRGLMYDLAPDAAWNVLELQDARDELAISHVVFLGAERAVQRGPWSTASPPPIRLSRDLPLLMKTSGPLFAHALGVTAAVRAHLALAESSDGGTLSHPLWHFPAGTPVGDVHRFLHRAQPTIGPDVWRDLRQRHADLDFAPGTPVHVALSALLATRNSGPRSAAQVSFLTWDDPDSAGTLTELNLAALEDTRELVSALGGALGHQSHTDADTLISALRPHAALLAQGFAWSNDARPADSA